MQSLHLRHESLEVGVMQGITFSPSVWCVSSMRHFKRVKYESLFSMFGTANRQSYVSLYCSTEQSRSVP